MRAAAQQATALAAALQDKLNATNEQLALSKNEIADLSANLQSAVTELTESKGAMAALTEKLSKAEAALQQAQQRAAAAETELASVKAAAERTHSELTHSREDMARQASEAAVAAQAAQAEIALLRRSLDANTVKLASVSAELKDLQEVAITATEQAESKVSRLKLIALVIWFC